jgi:hypothetical protein
MKTVKDIINESNYACSIERYERENRLVDIFLAVVIGLTFVGVLLEWWL